MGVRIGCLLITPASFDCCWMGRCETVLTIVSIKISQRKGSPVMTCVCSVLKRVGVSLLFMALAAGLSACSSAKPKNKKPEKIFERGWIGGDYKAVRTFPPNLEPKPKAGILVTALNAETPAHLAGLNEGD